MIAEAKIFLKFYFYLEIGERNRPSLYLWGSKSRQRLQRIQYDAEMMVYNIKKSLVEDKKTASKEWQKSIKLGENFRKFFGFQK